MSMVRKSWGHSAVDNRLWWLWVPAPRAQLRTRRGRHRETSSFAPTRRLFEIESGRELRQRDHSKNPPVYCETGGPDACVISSLPVLQHVLILQAPVLPQLQGGQQDHESAETRMPESQHAIVGIAEDVGRGDEPQPGHDFGHLLPALQRDIFELGKPKDQNADRKRIQDHIAAFGIDDLMARRAGKPWRQHDQHAKQHAAPVFPCSVGSERTKVPHGKPPLKEAYVSGWRA